MRSLASSLESQVTSLNERSVKTPALTQNMVSTKIGPIAHGDVPPARHQEGTTLTDEATAPDVHFRCPITNHDLGAIHWLSESLPSLVMHLSIPLAAGTETRGGVHRRHILANAGVSYTDRVTIPLCGASCCRVRRFSQRPLGTMEGMPRLLGG